MEIINIKPSLPGKRMIGILWLMADFWMADFCRFGKQNKFQHNLYF